MAEKRHIKVLLCSPRGTSGGIASWTEHILSYYSSISDVEVEMQWRNIPPAKVQTLGNTSIITRIIRGVKRGLSFQRFLSKELAKDNWDLVHFTTSASIALFRDLRTIRNAHKHGTKAVVHFHFGRIPEIYNTKGWEYRIIDKVIREADGVIVIDQKSYNTLISKGYNNIKLLPNPVSPTIVEFVNKNLETRKDRELLFAGHLYREKGVYELISACKSIPNIHLTMMGKGTPDIISDLRSRAGNGSESWLTITGGRPIEEVLSAMLSCSVFILPSYSEGFPNVILESMACGCPIVTTNVGAIPEMLDGSYGSISGICVKPKQVEELREAIVKMLDDKQYAFTCGINAQRRVNDNFSMPKIWAQMKSIWADVIKTS